MTALEADKIITEVFMSLENATEEEACAFAMATVALTEQAARSDPKPLTLDELRGMDGEPVRIEESPLWYGGNGVVSLAKGGVINPDDPNGCWPFENYGEWLACRSKPERSEG